MKITRTVIKPAVVRHSRIGVASTEDFFARGREVARALDAGDTPRGGMRLTFEDPKDFSRLINERRIEIMRMVRGKPGSITDIAEGLGRNRDAVARDLRQLEDAGLVLVKKITNPQHGQMNWVEPISDEVILEARI